MLSLTGKPYDTLQKALGLTKPLFGTLADLGITYDEADFTAGVVEEELDRLLSQPAQVVLLQRSRGYAQRPSLRIEDIAALVKAVKARQPEAVIF